MALVYQEMRAEAVCSLEQDVLVLLNDKSRMKGDLHVRFREKFEVKVLLLTRLDAEVTLECKNELAGVVIDRFGHDVWLIPQGEDHFKTRVLVSVSPQFFGWVTGIGSGMKITGPDNVKAEYKAYLQDVLENY